MIKRTRKQLKSFRSCLEDRLGEKLLGDTPAPQWLVRWSSMTFNRYQVGVDGRAGYERLGSRRCDIAICELGECVMYKELHLAETERDKANIEWKTSVYPGGMVRSNESVVGTEQGFIKACAVNKKSPERSVG